MKKLTERRGEQARNSTEDRVLRFRDGLVNYFESKGPQYKVVPLTESHPVKARVEISRLYTGQKVVDKYECEARGQKDVTYRVIIEENKNEPKTVRICFNQTLCSPIDGSPDERRMADEVYEAIRRYLLCHADPIKPQHVAEDRTPQLRYLMRE